MFFSIDGEEMHEMREIEKYGALEALKMAYSGHDEDSFETVYGELRFGRFNPHRKYFYFGNHGQLISTDSPSLERE